jgi:hypothetical protein
LPSLPTAAQTKATTTTKKWCTLAGGGN